MHAFGARLASMRWHALCWTFVFFLTTGCGASAASSPDATLPRSSRSTRVFQQAPALASVVARLERLSRAAAQAGNTALAQELRDLAELTELSASELVARLDAAGQRLRAAEARQRPHEETVHEEVRPQLENEPPAEVARTDTAPDRVRRPSGPSAIARPVREPSTTPEEVLRERLAQLAERLASVAPTTENRVSLESIQAALIEADRALVDPDGQARAVSNADEAERLLDALPNPRREEGAGTHDSE